MIFCYYFFFIIFVIQNYFMKKFEYQGKRQDQVKFSEKIAIFAIMSMVFIIGLVLSLKIFN